MFLLLFQVRMSIIAFVWFVLSFVWWMAIVKHKATPTLLLLIHTPIKCVRLCCFCLPPLLSASFYCTRLKNVEGCFSSMAVRQSLDLFRLSVLAVQLVRWDGVECKQRQIDVSIVCFFCRQKIIDAFCRGKTRRRNFCEIFKFNGIR